MVKRYPIAKSTSRPRQTRTRQPSRLVVSRKRYSKNRAVSRQQATYGENKFKGSNNSCLTPVPKPAGSQPLTYVFQNASNSIAGVLPEFTNARAMGLYSFPKGDDNNERNGDYMYIRQSYLKLEVQMLPVDTDQLPATLNATTDFRLMIVKANRKYNPLTKFPDPGQKLFLDTENNGFGYDDTTASSFEYMNQPINKRDFIVYADKRFTLSPPSVVLDDSTTNELVSLQNPRFSTKKQFNIKLPVWKKCHFDNDLSVPDNMDGQWLLICQAIPSAYCDATATAPPRNWVLSSYGTTSARDS